VSTKVPPSSRYASRIAHASARSAVQPKPLVPRPMVETTTPDVPRARVEGPGAAGNMGEGSRWSGARATVRARTGPVGCGGADERPRVGGAVPFGGE
jgi:hypothetical protein